MRRYIIDVGCSSDAGIGKMAQQKFGLPVVYIDADKASLDQVAVEPGDIKINRAITTHDGEIEFNFYQHDTHSVLQTNLQEIGRYVDGNTGQRARLADWKAAKVERVQCCRLCTVLRELGIDEVMFLKTDTQGHDLAVIKSLEDEVSRVFQIMCEVQVTDFEVYRGQSKKADVLEYLGGQGFALVAAMAQTYGQEENLLFRRGHVALNTQFPLMA
jgi:FkbM family methyltransferase